LGVRCERGTVRERIQRFIQLGLLLVTGWGDALVMWLRAWLAASDLGSSVV
jgi:hypothetical protein